MLIERASAAEWGELKIEDEKKTGRAVFAIRPEHIRIQKEKCENSLPGVVKNCVYRGAQAEVKIALEQDVIKAHISSEAEMAATGTDVYVTLPKEYLFSVA